MEKFHHARSLCNAVILSILFMGLGAKADDLSLDLDQIVTRSEAIAIVEAKTPFIKSQKLTTQKGKPPFLKERLQLKIKEILYQEEKTGLKPGTSIEVASVNWQNKFAEHLNKVAFQEDKKYPMELYHGKQSISPPPKQPFIIFLVKPLAAWRIDGSLDHEWYYIDGGFEPLMRRIMIGNKISDIHKAKK